MFLLELWPLFSYPLYYLIWKRYETCTSDSLYHLSFAVCLTNGKFNSGNCVNKNISWGYFFQELWPLAFWKLSEVQSSLAGQLNLILLAAKLLHTRTAFLLSNIAKGWCLCMVNTVLCFILSPTVLLKEVKIIWHDVRKCWAYFVLELSPQTFEIPIQLRTVATDLSPCLLNDCFAINK